MTTFGDILDDAFEPIGLANWVFDLEPEEQAKAFRALDAMMATAPWSALPYTPAGDAPNRGTTIATPAYANEAISANLSLRLAPGHGRTVSGEQRRIAREGLNLVRQRTADIPTDRRIPIRVKAAGAFGWWSGW